MLESHQRHVQSSKELLHVKRFVTRIGGTNTLSQTSIPTVFGNVFMRRLHPHPHLPHFLQVITSGQTAEQDEHVVVPVVEIQVLVGTEITSYNLFSPSVEIEFVKHTFGT